MFCKYCGKLITAPQCDACGKKHALQAYSQGLVQWMNQQDPEACQASAEENDAHLRDACAQSYEQGRQEGHRAGMAEGLSCANGKSKKRIRIALMLVCCIGVAIAGLAALTTYRSGYSAGRDQGYALGQEAGFSEGYTSGAALADMQQQTAYEEGYAAGRDAGYASGYQEGKTQADALPAPTFALTMILQKGSTGKEVALLQRCLQALGYYTGRVDDSFDPEVEEAVLAFQYSNALEADGIVGPGTWEMLLSGEAAWAELPASASPLPETVAPEQKPEASATLACTPAPTDSAD